MLPHPRNNYPSSSKQSDSDPLFTLTAVESTAASAGGSARPVATHFRVSAALHPRVTFTEDGSRNLSRVYNRPLPQRMLPDVRSDWRHSVWQRVDYVVTELRNAVRPRDGYVAGFTRNDGT